MKRLSDNSIRTIVICTIALSMAGKFSINEISNNLDKHFFNFGMTRDEFLECSVLLEEVFEMEFTDREWELEVRTPNDAIELIKKVLERAA